MNEFNELWKIISEQCCKRLTETEYAMWIKNLNITGFEGYTVTITTDESWKCVILNNKYKDFFENTFKEVAGFSVNVVFTSDDSAPVNVIQPEPPKPVFRDATARYTFSNFIVGDSNRFAYNVAMGAAREPGIRYNPLFIYGPSGVGKTHLMIATMNAIKQKIPSATTNFTTGEKFMTEVIESITHGTQEQFRYKYRNADVFLIDDIQFISKSESTQEEFFHTFETLKNNGRQIILTSDVNPKELTTLSQRITTRFEQGYICDIKLPDLETRMAIIKSKCEEFNIKLDNGIIRFIAENIKSSIRQIEGVLKKIDAYVNIEHREINAALIQDVVKEFTENARPADEVVAQIIESCTGYFLVTAEDIKGSKKDKNIALARQVAMKAAKELTGLTLNQIGAFFGKTHTAVIYNINTCDERMKNDSKFRDMVNEIIRLNSDNN